MKYNLACHPPEKSSQWTSKSVLPKSSLLPRRDTLAQSQKCNETRHNLTPTFETIKCRTSAMNRVVSRSMNMPSCLQNYKILKQNFHKTPEINQNPQLDVFDCQRFECMLIPRQEVYLYFEQFLQDHDHPKGPERHVFVFTNLAMTRTNMEKRISYI